MTGEVETVALSEGLSQSEISQGDEQKTELISSGEQLVPKKDLDGLRSSLQKETARERQARQIAEQQLSQATSQLQQAMAQLSEMQWRMDTSGMDDDERTNAQLQRMQAEVQNLRAQQAQLVAEGNMRAAIVQYVSDGVPEEELDMSSPQAMKRSAEKYKREQQREAELKKTLEELKAQLSGKVASAEKAGERKAREELGADAVDLGSPSGSQGDEDRLVRALDEAKKEHNATKAARLSEELQRLRRSR